MRLYLRFGLSIAGIAVALLSLACGSASSNGRESTANCFGVDLDVAVESASAARTQGLAREVGVELPDALADSSFEITRASVLDDGEHRALVIYFDGPEDGWPTPTLRIASDPDCDEPVRTPPVVTRDSVAIHRDGVGLFDGHIALFESDGVHYEAAIAWLADEAPPAAEQIAALEAWVSELRETKPR